MTHALQQSASDHRAAAMTICPPIRLPNGIPLPALAPLSEPLSAQVVHQIVNSRSVVDALRRFPQGLGRLLQAIGPLRAQVGHDLGRLVHADGIPVSQFVDLLRSASPSTLRPTVQLLATWRDRGVLEASRHGYLEPQRSAAVLLARRLLPTTTRNWLPDEVVPSEPLWWCWRQDGPDVPITVCPVPLPPDLPSTTLVWTPWAGATWLPQWRPIGTGALYVGGSGMPQAVRAAAAHWRRPLDTAVQTALDAAGDVSDITERAQVAWLDLATPLVVARFEPIVS